MQWLYEYVFEAEGTVLYIGVEELWEPGLKESTCLLIIVGAIQ